MPATELSGDQLSDLMGSLTGLGAMGMLHLFFGALLVAMGTRRCYRYPQSELEDTEMETTSS